MISPVDTLTARGAGLGGSLGARMAGAGIRAQIEEMARQFIVGADTKEALRKIAALRKDGFAAVLDVLGEATVSPKEEEHFERIYISFSAGKDSSVMFHLVMDEAIKQGRKVGVLFIDLEAQYQLTIKHAEQMFD